MRVSEISSNTLMRPASMQACASNVPLNILAPGTPLATNASTSTLLADENSDRVAMADGNTSSMRSSACARRSEICDDKETAKPSAHLRNIVTCFGLYFGVAVTASDESRTSVMRWLAPAPAALPVDWAAPPPSFTLFSSGPIGTADRSLPSHRVCNVPSSRRHVLLSRRQNVSRRKAWAVSPKPKHWPMNVMQLESGVST
mmetsp:Transcript_11599/g.36824  ORF Transcript_11599/g.36824 Transcript_11599/m.36824 type:complete len:201 (+) Transcript_11599:250-852(+)